MLKTVAFVLALSSSALADATISVGGPRYARPPVPDVVVVEDQPPTLFTEAPREELPKDPYRSPFRLTVGPAAITTGQGIGPGLLAALDLGTGTVGVRFAAAWFGGETPSDPNARLGSSVGLYSGELVLDLHKGGPVHPVVGLGLGALDIGRNGTNGWAVAGLGRAGLEYAIALEDADVRVGAGVLGGLVGPADPAAANTRAFVTMTGTFTIGF